MLNIYTIYDSRAKCSRSMVAWHCGVVDYGTGQPVLMRVGSRSFLCIMTKDPGLVTEVGVAVVKKLSLSF